eukprot:jgi/Botrbrau1/12867/Bobra.0188s0009.1
MVVVFGRRGLAQRLHMHYPHLQMVVNPGQNNLRCQTSILWYFPWYKGGGVINLGSM